ncbi:sulfurtransferase TusA family protein [Methylobacterium organophilum]|uniref:Sulfur carrier protein TusA n=1 Tax=Methylobacterium organophilum TaxID=410 RepID=A0ABQ4TB02_METOR|nr:sulfurtransferase TusA family protein [Methylobacterium organophilum]GJE27799.1 Sulfur carrier protein TusA [Methylobacterium organophilum]
MPPADAPALELDLVGLRCPLPALRTRKALRALRPGQRLVVRASDPLAGLDIPNAVREEGDRVEDQSREGAVFRFLLLRLPRPGEASHPAA